MRYAWVLTLIMAVMLSVAAYASRIENGRSSGVAMFTVVVDAGHGGHDAGAVGDETTEKMVNLRVALRLAELLRKDPGVRVVLTRSSDEFVPLQTRADMANKAGGNLFVSIHANSVDKSSPRRNTVSGASVYTLGLDRVDKNLEVAMRENSVMQLEKNYTATYQGFDPTLSESYIVFEMSQNKYMNQSVEAAQAVQNHLVRDARRNNHGVRQANFWVLLKTAMPSMLVELDFICNPTQEKYLASDHGVDELARAIAAGVAEYRGVSKTPPIVRETKEIAASLKAQPMEEASKPTPECTTPVYKIQILTSSKRLSKGDPQLKGQWPVETYNDGGTVKHTLGCYPTAKAAACDLSRVRTLFPDAFVVTMINGKRVK